MPTSSKMQDEVLTKVLTMSIEFSALLCFPAVITSHPWPSVVSHSATCIGVRFARKSPDSSSTNKHRPSEVYNIYTVNARRCLSSRVILPVSAFPRKPSSPCYPAAAPLQMPPGRVLSPSFEASLETRWATQPRMIASRERRI